MKINVHIISLKFVFKLCCIESKFVIVKKKLPHEKKLKFYNRMIEHINDINNKCDKDSFIVKGVSNFSGIAS